MSRNLLWLCLAGLACITVSCGSGPGGTMGFFELYMREFRKGLAETGARHADNATFADRSRRFEQWFKSPEGKSAIEARTRKLLVAETDFPDTVYEMGRGTEFRISSRSAGATLKGEIDHRDGVASAWLRRPDGTTRHWEQGVHADILGDMGDSFDDDDRLAAALLRSNPRPGWPGRGVARTRRDFQAIRGRMWEEMTGEKLRYYF